MIKINYMNNITIKSYFHETRIYIPEEYIKFRLLDSPSHAKYTRIFAKNTGITKDDLKQLAISKYGINDIKSKTTKEEILDKILIKEDIFVLAKMFNIGVKWYQYAESFDLSMEQVTKLESVGFLIPIDTELNNYAHKETLYDIKQFADMTQEMIDKVLKEYNIHKGDKDTCIENINNIFEFNKEMKKAMNDEEGRFNDIEEFADNPEGYMKRHSEQ